jgi:hypothetical protein
MRFRLPSERWGLTNAYVENFMKKKTKCKMFRGVYPADKIPSTLKEQKEFSVIVNLSESTDRGTHFVCIIKSQDSTACMYLDPLALNFTLASFIPTFISTLQCRDVTTLRHPIQSGESHYCGYFCIFLCMLFDVHTDQHAVGQIKSFSSQNLSANDAICMRNIRRLL